MSRETDVLFCKIAINAGLVSAENAQQVIAFCNKREQDTGRRPLVGTVFAKNQLLTAEQVNKVNEVLARRTGVPVGRSTSRRKGPIRAPSGGKRKAGSKQARQRQRVQKRRPLDRRARTMGVGFSLIFLSVVVAIVWLYYRNANDSETAEQQAVNAVTERDKPRKEEKQRPKEKKVVLRDLPEDSQEELNFYLIDLKRSTIDNSENAWSLLEQVEGDIAEYQKQGFAVPEHIRQGLEETRASLQKSEGEGVTEEVTESQPVEADTEEVEESVDLDVLLDEEER